LLKAFNQKDLLQGTPKVSMPPHYFFEVFVTKLFPKKSKKPLCSSLWRLNWWHKVPIWWRLNLRMIK